MITKVLENKLEPNDRVLDVGTKNARKFKNINAEIVGVDVEVRPELDHVQYMYGDGGQLPFKSNSFDYVVCTQVLEHVPHTGQIIEEVSRVLRSDGEFFLNFPNRFFPDQPHSPPGYFSFIPRSLAVRIAPYLLDESSVTYYRENVFNLSPLTARWYLHQYFDVVDYSTIKHKREFSEIFLGEKTVEQYESDWRSRLFARLLPFISTSMKFLLFQGFIELFYPHTEYVCRHPKKNQ